MPRPLLVGMTNPYVRMDKFTEALYPAPEGCTGWRLWQMISEVSGISRDQYVEKFSRTNLDEPDLDEKVEASTVIIPLGRVAWGHFRLPAKARPLTGIHRSGKKFVLVPHPSGRNLWYNDPANRRAVGEFLSALCSEEELP
jgi:hypothetical protein